MPKETDGYLKEEDKKLEWEEDIAMQHKCVHCRKEQYMMAVYPISMGEHPCVWCGKMSKKMTKEEYREALKELK